MRMPSRWVPIRDPSEVAAFLGALHRELSPGHCLADLPLRAIGRRWDDTLVLFAMDDGSGRVAQVVLPWKSQPMDSPFPLTILFKDFQEWERSVEYAEWLARLKPDPDIVPSLKAGDRVRMLKHYDWKADCLGTIVGEGRPRIIFDGSTRVEYFVRFDEPQTDLTDESADLHIEYEGTTTLEEYLQPLGDGLIA